MGPVRACMGWDWYLRALIGVGVVGVGAMAILVPTCSRARDRSRDAACRLNLARIARALDTYADRHDNRLPPADGWERAIAPYLDADSFRCGSHGYALDAALAGKEWDMVAAPLVRETEAAHGGCANVLLADGSLRRVR